MSLSRNNSTWSTSLRITKVWGRAWKKDLPLPSWILILLNLSWKRRREVQDCQLRQRVLIISIELAPQWDTSLCSWMKFRVSSVDPRRHSGFRIIQHRIRSNLILCHWRLRNNWSEISRMGIYHSRAAMLWLPILMGTQGLIDSRKHRLQQPWKWHRGRLKIDTLLLILRLCPCLR